MCFIIQSDAGLMSDNVHMVLCARNVMDLIEEIGIFLEYGLYY